LKKYKKCLKARRKVRILIQIVVTGRNQSKVFSGLNGILKTARLENPKIVGQLIEVEQETPNDIGRILLENAQYPEDGWIGYQSGVRYVEGWNEITIKSEDVPWKDNGVYLITGGTGGLGLIFAEEIARKTKGSKLILTGRSELDKNKQTRIKELKELGAGVQYRQVDVTDRGAVFNLIDDIVKEFGTLNGIMHSAGVIRDNYIIKKTGDEMLEVLKPKVSGTVYLDQASKDLPIEFFVMFSSTSGRLGNPGQADYASANAFMDEYAIYRNSLAAAGERCGRTLSVGWPLWADGGMRISEENLNMMRIGAGIVPLRTVNG
jgi:polyketide synthase PksN